MNKENKTKVVIALIVFVLLLSVCVIITVRNIDKTVGDMLSEWSDNEVMSGRFAELAKRSEEVTLAELTPVKYSDFLEKSDYLGKKDGFSEISLLDFNSLFSIELARVIDKTTAYAVYKLSDGDDTLYAYIVFDNKLAEEKNGVYESWVFKGEFYIVSRTQKYSESFNSSIDTGNKAAEVYPEFARLSEIYGGNGIIPILLSDGLLTFSFSLAPEGDKTVLTSSFYSSYENIPEEINSVFLEKYDKSLLP